MALFVTRHQHSPETCPAGGPHMGPMLLRHLSDENATRVGINIQGSSALNDHTLFMVPEGPDQQKVDEFTTPFG